MSCAGHRPAVFFIPPHLPFLDALVAGIRSRTGDDPLTLSRVTVLLPTRRACRSLSEAFLRASGGQPLLLPRLRPVGDASGEDEMTFGADGGGRDAATAAAEIPPAIPSLRRLLLLSRLVLRWGESHAPAPLLPGQAAVLARELARFLDETQAEGCDLACLADLVPAEYAEHWQHVLRFLAVVAEHWPEILKAEGALDPAEYRNQMLRAQAAAWRRNPPPHLVVAAGLGGGMPALDELVETVARLPNGAVVLPGIDAATGDDEETWQAVHADPAHPQHLAALLLDRLEIAPADIRPWPAPGVAGGPAARIALAAEALRPAAATDRWRDIAPWRPDAIRGMWRLDCPGPQEEAAAVALLMRQRLERPGETAALVTPDRGLARRVAAELRRWNIEVDDSAGTKLSLTPPGVFLRLVLDAAAFELAPLPLLALGKHPLAAAGMRTAAFRDEMRRLERRLLRGPRPASGVEGLLAALPAGDEDGLRPVIERIGAAMAPLLAALAEPDSSLAGLLAAHVAAAEALAATPETAGADALWREEAGETAAQFLAELASAADAFQALAGKDYPALFEALLAEAVVRPRYGRHPRLAIWGLLEARLQHADLMILGGLNEGTWPPETEGDPWLSRPMRREFGLSPPERRVGLAAHDFSQALGAREVVLTRAVRIEGTPTVPSRWLLRLDTVLRAGKMPAGLPQPESILEWQALLDRPAERLAIAPPAPTPPVAARPRRLSVTQIETWRRDPYAIYARTVLKLYALDPLDADPGAAERGEVIHHALDRFVAEWPAPQKLPPDAEARLIAIGREAFGPALSRPGVWAFWWPRFERIARWFVAIERERRQELAATCTEVQGSLTFDAPAGPFTLTGKADRIDRTLGGGLVVIDYKTGGVPTKEDVTLGFSPQLLLEAAIGAAGGFPGVAAEPAAELAYWRLTGGNPAGEIETRGGGDPDEVRRLVAEAVEGLRSLVARFDDPATPYLATPRPERAPRYSDYGHLARLKEWSLATDVGG